MTEFLQGATMMACLGIAAFFLVYWKQTRDRLFLALAAAFVVFAINRVLLAALNDRSEAETWVYVLRAAGFVLIAAAVLDKNYGSARRQSGQ